jgi:hypothetical protein
MVVNAAATSEKIQNCNPANDPFVKLFRGMSCLVVLSNAEASALFR